MLIANLSTAVPLVCINMLDQKGKKLSDSDLSSSSHSEPSETKSLCDKEEVKSETSSLMERNSNTSTDIKTYGALNQNTSPLP